MAGIIELLQGRLKFRGKEMPLEHLLKLILSWVVQFEVYHSENRIDISWWDCYFVDLLHFLVIKHPVDKEALVDYSLSEKPVDIGVSGIFPRDVS